MNKIKDGNPKELPRGMVVTRQDDYRKKKVRGKTELKRSEEMGADRSLKKTLINIKDHWARLLYNDDINVIK